MSKIILDSSVTKQRALETISEMAAAVKATLGPGGNPIILQRQGQNPDGTAIGPLVTKDGVTVAEYIAFKSNVKDTIAKAILQVAKNTVNQAGDGTTTAVVLAEAIYRAGYRHIEQGRNSIQLYEELNKIKNEIIAQIDKVKKSISEDEILDVALISANGDKEIAEIVQKAIMAVGEDGHIALEEGASRETEMTQIEGAVYKQGWSSLGPAGSHLVTDRLS